MKILGLSLLSILIILTGNTFAVRKMKRIELLDSISLMIKSIESQITYSHLSVPELLSFISTSSEFSALSFIKQVSLLLSQGSNYKIAWETALNDFVKANPFSKEDCGMLLAFANGLGNTDIEGQKSNCITYSKLFELKADSLRKKAETSAKICNSMGMLTAALIFIILY